MMWNNITSVDDRIAECLIWVVHADFGAYAPFLTFFSHFGHLGEPRQVFIDSGVSSGGGFAFHALFAHLGWDRISTWVNTSTMRGFNSMPSPVQCHLRTLCPL